MRLRLALKCCSGSLFTVGAAALIRSKSELASLIETVPVSRRSASLVVFFTISVVTRAVNELRCTFSIGYTTSPRLIDSRTRSIQQIGELGERGSLGMCTHRNALRHSRTWVGCSRPDVVAHNRQPSGDIDLGVLAHDLL